MKHCIVVDLDGTVANCDHRLEHAQSKDWDKFHSLCTLDPPYPDVLNMIRHLSHMQLIGCTGRNESHRLITMDWLRRNGLALDYLLMRPDGNYDNALDLKIKMLEGHFGSKASVLDSVLAVFDDTDKVVVGLRDYGLTVLQPREGAY